MADTSMEIAINIRNISLESLEQTGQRLELDIYEKITNASFEDLRKLTLCWRNASYQMDFFIDTQDSISAEFKEKLYLIGYMKGLLGLAGRFGRRQWERQQIQNTGTKHKDDILLALYNHKHLYHGELAKQIHVSSTNLNGIIKRMNKCPVPLLNIETNSKYTIYSLSLPAMEYTREVLLPARDSHKDDSFKFVGKNDFVDLQEEKKDRQIRLINRMISSDQSESFVGIPPLTHNGRDEEDLMICFN